MSGIKVIDGLLGAKITLPAKITIVGIECTVELYELVDKFEWKQIHKPIEIHIETAEIYKDTTNWLINNKYIFTVGAASYTINNREDDAIQS